MEISVVIPCFNEELRVKSTVTKIMKYLTVNKYNWEIIIVNDGSTDKTENVIRSIKSKRVRVVSYGKNHGKGYAVNQGFLHATKSWVLFSDADLSTPIEELRKFLPFTKEYSVIVGSRNLPGSVIKIKQPWFRSTLGKIFPLCVKLIMQLHLNDTQCGFKLFRKDVANSITRYQKIFGWGFDVEILYIAQSHKYKIHEVPIVWLNDAGSKLNPIRDSFRMLRELLKIRLNAIRGFYK